ncbi:DUF2690 domain-containing protein [Kitasatospora sp. NPDC093558]|uniref:DUF2690 domain-containing protein n=1 Tax=Kitasatospora sp. NPDC093558 TaxID=3155201 RepID=UPI0034355671
MLLPLHRRTPRAAAVLLVLGAALATAAAPPAPAAPRQGCTGDGCYQLDPVEEGCADDAVTVDGASATIGDMRVDLRYSESCRASWAQARTTPDLRKILVGTHGASEAQVEYNDLGTKTIYTNMVDGTTAGFVCIYPRRGNPNCGNVVTPSAR